LGSPPNAGTLPDRGLDRQVHRDRRNSACGKYTPIDYELTLPAASGPNEKPAAA
jgi:hypothetical protein